MRKLNVLIAGSTGYIGIQLIKLLVKHKNVNIKYLCGNSSVGKKVSYYEKSLIKKKLPKITKFKKDYLKHIDVIFTALPNGEAQFISNFLLDKNILIDLAADFRLKKVLNTLNGINKNINLYKTYRIVFMLYPRYRKKLLINIK